MSRYLVCICQWYSVFTVCIRVRAGRPARTSSATGKNYDIAIFCWIDSCSTTRILQKNDARIPNAIHSTRVRPQVTENSQCNTLDGSAITFCLLSHNDQKGPHDKARTFGKEAIGRTSIKRSSVEDGRCKSVCTCDERVCFVLCVSVCVCAGTKQ